MHRNRTIWLSFTLASGLLFPATAGAQETSEILVGRWKAQLKIDDDKLAEIAGDQQLNDASIAEMKEQLRNASQTLELTGDGTSRLTSQGYPGQQVEQAGSWKVVSSEPAKYLTWNRETFLTGSYEMKNVTKVVLAGSTDDGAESEITIFLDGGNRFIMTSEQIQASPFAPPVFERVE